MPTPSPEFLADKPVFAMLAEMVGALQARRIDSEPAESPVPPTIVPTSPSPLNRRSRRAQAKEARKSRSLAR